MSRPEPRTTHAAALALGYADRIVVRTARDVHRAVAGRAFGWTRVVGGPLPQRVHDTVADFVYGAVSTGLRGSQRALSAAAERGIGWPVESGSAGRQLVSAVNGLVGAELAERGDPHAIAMSVRSRGRDVPTDPNALGQAFPDASDRIVVLLHGLGENDDSWCRNADVRGETYASRIEHDTTYTPVAVRYNTGLNVSTNGAELSGLIAELVARWPVAVSRIALVGHSMGGLVARAATNHAIAAGMQWPHDVRHVVCLGTPHLGAALEKAVHVGARAMRVFPEAAPFGRILDTRSPGIVDLRHGYITREEWEGQDLTARWGLDRLAAAPLPHADYHFVAATLGVRPTDPLSRAIGDVFVRFPSAVGRAGRGRPVVGNADVRHIGGADHFALLNHPRVAGWLVDWLGDGHGELESAPTERAYTTTEGVR
ncbi:MAG: esterase/lipase family protein [Nocardioidaceae bacterium]